MTVAKVASFGSMTLACLATTYSTNAPGVVISDDVVMVFVVVTKAVDEGVD